MDEQPNCRKLGIPSRLHKNGRGEEPVENDDILYFHYPTVPSGSSEEERIRDTLRGVGQSTNSDNLNIGGTPSDLLYNTKNRGILEDKAIGCLPVDKVRAISFPQGSHKSKAANGEEIPPEYMFTVDVEHVPTDCIYPHCEIRPILGNVKKKNATDYVTSVMRTELFDIFEDNKHLQRAWPNPTLEPIDEEITITAEGESRHQAEEAD